MSCLLRPITVIALVIASICSYFGKQRKDEYSIKRDLLESAQTELSKKQEGWKEFKQEVAKREELAEKEITLLKARCFATKRSIDEQERSLISRGLKREEIDSLVGKSPDEIRSSLSSAFLRHLPTDNRLRNGSVIRDELSTSTSDASLTLDNGLSEDAYVKLVGENRRVASFYVRSNSGFTFKGIPDGRYRVMYSLGFGWDSNKQDFTRGRTAELYDDTFVYDTRVQSVGRQRTIYYDKVSLTLHKVLSGNTTTTDMSIEEFDRF